MAQIKSAQDQEKLEKNVILAENNLYKIYTNFCLLAKISKMPLKRLRNQKRPIIKKNNEGVWVTRSEGEKISTNLEFSEYIENTVNILKSIKKFLFIFVSYFSNLTEKQLYNNSGSKLPEDTDMVQFGEHGKKEKKSLKSKSRNAIMDVMVIVVGFSKIDVDNLEAIGKTLIGTRNSDFKAAYRSLNRLNLLFHQSGIYFFKRHFTGIINIYQSVIKVILNYISCVPSYIPIKNEYGIVPKKFDIPTEDQKRVNKKEPTNSDSKAFIKPTLLLSDPDLVSYMTKFPNPKNRKIMLRDPSHATQKLVHIFLLNRKICKTVDKENPVHDTSTIFTLDISNTIVQKDVILNSRCKISVQKKGNIFVICALCIASLDTAVSQYHIILGKVAVLSFGNATQGGGGVVSGCNAQEENINRLTNLFSHLTDDEVNRNFYAVNSYIKKFIPRLLYTSGVVQIMKDSPNYEVLDPKDRKKIDIITAAAPKLAPNIAPTKEETEQLSNMVRLILEAAKTKGVDTLVLGAFGCGVYNWPPKLVVNIFENLLINEKYRYYFNNIIFAIPTANYTFQVFKKLDKHEY